MMKKTISILIAVIIFALCFTACEKDDEIYLACAVDEMPRCFDPQISTSTSEKIVAVNIFDGLFKLHENGEPQKCAVKDYTVSADGLVYTFTLHNNLKYYISDEVKAFLEENEKSIEGLVTARDFVFGITRAILPETNSQNYALLSIIKNADLVHNGEMDSSELGVKALNEYTLEITLEKKSSNFLYALTQPVSFPCDEEFFNLTDGRYGLDEEYIISNGAFYLSDIKDGESVRFTRNEEYVGTFNTTVTSVRLHVNSNEIDIAKKVDDGTYDLGFFANEDAIDELGRKVTKNNIQNITTALVFNMKKEALQNIKLRTGLISSIDMATVVGEKNTNVVPSGYKLSGGKVESLPYNIDYARENMISAFEELNYDNLTISVLCTPEYEETAKAIVNCWQANIGVELNGKVIVAEEDEYYSKIRSGEYSLVIYDLTVDSDKSADFLSIFATDNEKNVFGYSSGEYDRMIGELKVNSSQEKVADCESHLLKNAIVMPMNYKDTIFAVAKGTSDVYSAGDKANIYFYKGQK